MKAHLTDLFLSLILFGIVAYYLQQEPSLEENIPLQDQNQETFISKDPAIVHFWAPWSKPSLRQLQLFQRFTQTHKDIALIGVHSIEEDPDQIKAVKLENGWYFPFVQAHDFPQLPYTIIIKDGKRQVFDNALYYEKLLEIFDKNH